MRVCLGPAYDSPRVGSVLLRAREMKGRGAGRESILMSIFSQKTDVAPA